MPARFEVIAPFQPAGDQPRAIAELGAGLTRGDRYQTLLGVTGSGKTMTLAHVIADETEAAYRRGNLLTKRRALMEAWAAYLAGPPMGNVVQIRSAG